jgi:hypothetical protein
MLGRMLVEAAACGVGERQMGAKLGGLHSVVGEDGSGLVEG